MDYRYVKQETLHYNIVESQTGYTVIKDLDFDKARDMARHLNLGGGFGGWTPLFFLTKFEPIDYTSTQHPY